jgi:hypothetical protein
LDAPARAQLARHVGNAVKVLHALTEMLGAGCVRLSRLPRVLELDGNRDRAGDNEIDGFGDTPPLPFRLQAGRAYPSATSCLNRGQSDNVLSEKDH